MISWFKSQPDHYKYGLAVWFAVLFGGQTTGMGGAFLPNFIFAILMGVMAALMFRYITRNKSSK